MKYLGPVLLAITGAVSASASPLIIGPGGGALNLTNLSVQVTGTSAAGCINFYSGSLIPDACNATPDNLSTIAPLDPVLFGNGVTGTIRDIINSAPTTAFLSIPGGTGGQGTVTFDLLGLEIPNPAACPTGTNPATPFVCDLTNSPFVFSGNVPGSITVSFVTDLCAYTGASGGSKCSNGTPYTATFSSQFQGTFNGGTPVTLLNLITAEQSVNGITDSVSATLSPAPVSQTPEPGTLALAGLAFVAAGMLRQRRRTE